jgi:bacterial/archaeal transporter family protein
LGKTWGLTVTAILTNVSGDLLLSRGMHHVGQIVFVSPLQYLRAFANPCTILGICILVCWLVTQLTLLSRADLSFVLPITASTYILIALCGHFLFDEQISAAQWIGVAAISMGTVLVGCTPARTTKPHPEHEL